MVFHGQDIMFYKKTNRMMKKRIRRSRLKIRPRRWDFFGKVRSTSVKQYRGNFWANARFKKNYAKKLSAYRDYVKNLERGFSETFRPHYLLETGATNTISFSVLKYLKRNYRKFRNFHYPVDLTANKKFYRTFNKTLSYRHTRAIQLHRIKAFLGNTKQHHLRAIWRTGTIKQNKYSANAFTFRFISRLPHLLYFCGFTCSLELAIHLVKWGFVTVNNITITNTHFLVPVMASVQLQLTDFYKQICAYMLFPYHRIYAASFFETNWKLFSVRILRIPSYREVIFPDAPFDHMFLYEQLAPIVN